MFQTVWRYRRQFVAAAGLAAILAAVGAEVHPNIAEAVTSFVAFRPEEHEPDPKARDAYDEAYARYRDVYFAMKPVFGP